MENSRFRFRAWDKKDKKMRYPNMPVNGQALGVNDIFLHIAGPIHQYLAGRMIVAEGVKHLEIMQYTGLKDKNGKEICEGDIVKWGAESFNMEVLRKKGCFVAKTNAGIGSRHFWFNECWGPKISEFEIIGNIHEHKHLLDSN